MVGLAAVASQRGKSSKSRQTHHPRGKDFGLDRRHPQFDEPLGSEYDAQNAYKEYFDYRLSTGAGEDKTDIPRSRIS
jgi:hypothetical protein